MSKRAAGMLEEDMEYLYPVNESDEESARQVIVDIYDDLIIEDRFDDAFIRYKCQREDKNTNADRNYIVLIFRGTGTIAQTVAVYLFEEYYSAENFCSYLNNLEQEEDCFIYAKYAEQMVEYETEKPLLVLFDQLFEDSNFLKEYNRNIIFDEALKKFNSETLLQAFKGLNKRSRMLLMQTLPIKTTDEINECIERHDDKYYCTSGKSRQAQQKVLNAVNKTVEKFMRKNRFPEVLKD
jgi:hypothetical protein